MEELLKRLCAARGVSGSEESVCGLIKKEISPLADKVTITPDNSVIAEIGSVDEHNILLDAHIDQIGFIVTYIDKNGFLKVSQCGGMDYRAVPDARFKVLTKSGALTAVACCMPPHLSDGGEDKAPDKDAVYLDTGLPAQRVFELVSVGDTAAYDVEPTMLRNGRFTCCSTDNRACCALLVCVAKMIAENPVNTGVTLAFTSQEETFGKGASASAFSVMPDEAIVADVSFAVQPSVSDSEAGKLGGGPMICISPVLSRKMTDALISAAKENSIPYQFEVVGGRTGTNADKISITQSGIPTALVSVPQSSMHTPAEIVSLSDIEATAKLIYEYIKTF